MTIAVANTANTNTFDYWKTRTNELADAMSNKVVTTNSNTTTGNATVNGYVIATGLIGNSINGGNSTVVTALTVTSNLTIATGNILTVGNSTINVVTNSSSITIGSLSVTNTTINRSNIDVLPYYVNTQTSGTSAQIVDSFAIATYRSAEYILNITNNSANGYQTNKILILHDGGSIHWNEYSIMFSNTLLGTYSANANTTHVRLLLTPTASNTQVKGYKQLIQV